MLSFSSIVLAWSSLGSKSASCFFLASGTGGWKAALAASRLATHSRHLLRLYSARLRSTCRSNCKEAVDAPAESREEAVLSLARDCSAFQAGSGRMRSRRAKRMCAKGAEAPSSSEVRHCSAAAKSLLLM